MNPIIRCCAMMIVAVLTVLHGSVTAQTSPAAPPVTTDRNLNLRDSTRNSHAVFTRTGKGHVAFIGGSITEMNGYRPMLQNMLRKKFPATQFTFTDAGIASTCSTTGAHRLHEDVLSKGKVDLFFIEFAVNDDQDASHAGRDAIRGLEGIIRQCRASNPQMDIIVTHFVNESMIARYQKGQPTISIEAHEAVCKAYGISSVLLAKEVSQLIEENKLTWKIYGGTHPGPVGNALAAQMCAQVLEASWKNPAEAASDYAMPSQAVDAGHYGGGKFIDVSATKMGDGWTVSVPDWKKIPGSFRDRFGGKPVLMSTKPGAGASLKFEGQAVGVFVLAGPDAGILEVSVDGGPWSKVNLFHRFSGGLHYPRTVMLATDLKPGPHEVSIRLSEEQAKGSKGTAARILKWAVN